MMRSSGVGAQLEWLSPASLASPEPEVSTIAVAYELRSRLTEWFAERGWAAVVDVVGDALHPVLEIRFRTGIEDPEDAPNGTFEVAEVPSDEQFPGIVASLRELGLAPACPMPAANASGSVWCAPD